MTDLQSSWEHVDLTEAYTSAVGMISISTWRLKVPGGWLYKVTEWNDIAIWKEDAEKAKHLPHYDIKLCFVPEKNNVSQK